jgi:hypothetical protein
LSTPTKPEKSKPVPTAARARSTAARRSISDSPVGAHDHPAVRRVQVHLVGHLADAARHRVDHRVGARVVDAGVAHRRARRHEQDQIGHHRVAAAQDDVAVLGVGAQVAHPHRGVGGSSLVSPGRRTAIE